MFNLQQEWMYGSPTWFVRMDASNVVSDNRGLLETGVYVRRHLVAMLDCVGVYIVVGPSRLVRMSCD